MTGHTFLLLREFGDGLSCRSRNLHSFSCFETQSVRVPMLCLWVQFPLLHSCCHQLPFLTFFSCCPSVSTPNSSVPNSISCTFTRQGSSEACSWLIPLNLRGCVVGCGGSGEKEGLRKEGRLRNIVLKKLMHKFSFEQKITHLSLFSLPLPSSVSYFSILSVTSFWANDLQVQDKADTEVLTEICSDYVLGHTYI